MIPRTLLLFPFFVACLLFSVKTGVGATTQPFIELSYPGFGLSREMAFPSTAYRAADDTILCAFAVKGSGSWDSIYLVSTRDAGVTWSQAVKVMSCPAPGYIADPSVLVSSTRVTVFATFVPKDPTGKFASSEFLQSSSADGIAGWSRSVRLAVGHRYVSGKVQTPIWLGPGTMLMGYSYDLPAERGKPAARESDMCASAGVLRSVDDGLNWTAAGDVVVSQSAEGADEPALVRLSGGRVFMIVRTSTQHPYETFSNDGGLSWEKPAASKFNGYNSPSALLRLNDGKILRVWDNSSAHRYPLAAAVSGDDARTWSQPRTILDRTGAAGGGFNFETACYPSMAQAAGGTVVLLFWETTKSGSRLGLARMSENWAESLETTSPASIRSGD
jgi:hypothetical protein